MPMRRNAVVKRRSAITSATALPTPPTEFLELDMGDGLCFDAWMIKPPEFDETKKYPVLVYVCKLRQS